MSDVELIDGLRAVELLEKAVAERGEEYVYERVPFEYGLDLAETLGRCQYVHDGQPSCLVGMALSIHGVPLSLLEQDNHSPVGVLRHRFLSSPAVRVFDAAQQAQDVGLTWGEALKLGRLAQFAH